MVHSVSYSKIKPLEENNSRARGLQPREKPSPLLVLIPEVTTKMEVASRGQQRISHLLHPGEVNDYALCRPTKPLVPENCGENGAVYISIPSYIDLGRGPETVTPLSGQRVTAQNVTFLRPWRVNWGPSQKLSLALTLFLKRKSH